MRYPIFVENVLDYQISLLLSIYIFGPDNRQDKQEQHSNYWFLYLNCIFYLLIFSKVTIFQNQK